MIEGTQTATGLEIEICLTCSAGNEKIQTPTLFNVPIILIQE